MKKKILITFLLLFPSICQATTYYIRDDGSAANKESATSCSAAASAMNETVFNSEAGNILPGDTICICPDGGAIQSALNPGVAGTSGNYVIWDGDCDGDGARAEVQGGISRLLTVKADYQKFQNIHFTTSAKAISLALGASNGWVTNCFFDGLTQQGIYGSGPSNSAYAEDWLIENSTFTNIGVYTDSASADINFTGFTRQITARGNTHTGDGTHGVDGINFANVGVSGGDGSGHLIEDSTFTNYYENALDFKGTSESSGGEGRSIARRCKFIGNSGTEGLVHVHYNGNGITLDDCEFNGTSSNAIALVGVGVGDDATGDVIVKNSLFIDVAKNIFTDAGLLDGEALGGNQLLNNTALNCGSITAGYSIDIGSNNWILKNNILKNSSLNSDRDIPIRFNDVAFYTSATIDYNAYKKSDETYDSLVIITGVGYKSFSDLQTDGHEAHGYYVEPYLDANGNLTAESPATVKDGGAFIDGEYYIGTGPSIGRTEWTDGLLVPWSIALSLCDGSVSPGNGKLYTAPSSNFLLNDGSSIFLLNNGDKFLLN